MAAPPSTEFISNRIPRTFARTYVFRVTTTLPRHRGGPILAPSVLTQRVPLRPRIAAHKAGLKDKSPRQLTPQEIGREVRRIYGWTEEEADISATPEATHRTLAEKNPGRDSEAGK